MTHDTPPELLVETHADGKIAIVTLNRPDKRNAFNASLLATFTETMASLDADPAVRVIVLTGAGKVFCAGMDLADFAGGDGEKIIFDGGIIDHVRRERCTPVIAAIRGAAMAGGFEFMLSCDLVVAANDARFGLPEVGIGLIAGAGGVAHLPTRIPVAIAREILLTGAPITAQRAYEAGLVNKITTSDDVLPTAIALAEQVAGNAPLAVAATMRVIHHAIAGDANLDQNNVKELRAVMRSADANEGARAFTGRRAPQWTGT